MKFVSVLPFLLVGVCVIIGSVEARPQQLQKRAEQNEGLESSAEDDLKGAASSYSFEYYPDTYPYTYRYRYSNPYYGYYRYGAPYYSTSYYRGGLGGFYSGLFY